MKYRVIFNNDPNDYVELDDLEDAEGFAERFGGRVANGDKEINIGYAGMFHTLEPVLQDLYSKKAKIQDWIDALNDDPTPEEFQRILQEIQND